MKERTRRLLEGALLLIFIVCISHILWKAFDHRKGAAEYKEASAMAGLEATAGEAVLSEADEYAAALAKTDLAALREVNSDVVGWIAIPDTEISYPIMQTTDNSYYLNYTWNNERSSVGAIFLDCRNNLGLLGFHTLIYGHQMRNGSMFGGLHQYRDEEYLRAHPIIYIVTDEGVQKYDIFAAFEASVQEIVYQFDIEEEGRQQEFIDYCLSHSVVDTGIVPETDGHIITLSTCTGRGYSTRWVVQGVQRKE